MSRISFVFLFKVIVAASILIFLLELHANDKAVIQYMNILQRHKTNNGHVVYVRVDKNKVPHHKLAITDVKDRDSAFQQPKNSDMGIDHLPSNFAFLINPARKCSFTNSTSESVILVGVESAPSHFDSRSAIRQTWANRNLQKNHSTRVVFLVGIPESVEIQEELSRESLEYDDIVQGSFQEHYRNLTRKTIMFLRWSYYFCLSANFVIKTDDDVFVNLMIIVPQLSLMPKGDIYLGQHQGNPRVIRDPQNKWYTSYDVYPDEYYPSYNIGALYIISGDLSRRCYEYISENRTGYISSEDAYIGVIMSKLGVPLSTYSIFDLDGATLNQPYLYWEYPVIHDVSARMMLEYWSSLEQIRSRDIDKIFNDNTNAEMTILEDIFLAIVVTTPASQQRWRNNYRQVVKPASIIKNNSVDVIQVVCKTDNEIVNILSEHESLYYKDMVRGDILCEEDNMYEGHVFAINWAKDKLFSQYIMFINSGRVHINLYTLLDLFNQTNDNIDVAFFCEGERCSCNGLQSNTIMKCGLKDMACVEDMASLQLFAILTSRNLLSHFDRIDIRKTEYMVVRSRLFTYESRRKGITGFACGFRQSYFAEFWRGKPNFYDLPWLSIDCDNKKYRNLVPEPEVYVC
uniref:Uncharacterized protein LOC100371092 n=1 Tax=Saccoglossus kowalevskii TaxID=10224 RepID=A0ABM0GK39_SACKO|nr:PREDICTED: uncharacterized protein LOC100371092 [Saccoglossus kowalevskii]